MKIQKLKVISSMLVSFLFLLNMVSCATLNESECKTANWEIIGLEDGSKGKPTSFIGEHRQACSEYNVAPDLDAYLRGHRSGMRQFCTAQNGYQQGLRGNSFNQTCPADLSANFKNAYQKGYRLYQIGAEINQLKQQRHSDEERIAEIEDIKQIKENELLAHNTREYRRRELLSEIKDLERESESIHHNLEESQGILIRLEQDYQRYSRSNY